MKGGTDRMTRDTRLAAFLFCSLLLGSGIAEAVDIDARGSRMEVISEDTIMFRGVNVGPQTYWGELRWNPCGNVFALTGHYGLESGNAHPPLPTPGDWSASAVWNGRLYVIGGGGRYDAIEAYDPESREWDVRRQHRVLRVVTVGDLIYVLSSSSFGSPTFWKYDPSRDMWTSLPQPPTSGGVSELAEVERGDSALYNPATNSWEPGEPILTPRGGYVTGEALLGSVYVAGGYDDRAADRLESYNPLVPSATGSRVARTLDVEASSDGAQESADRERRHLGIQAVLQARWGPGSTW
jgi:hypothetical protein